jgi:hypothetical protein
MELLILLASEGLLTGRIRRAILSKTCYASASPNNNTTITIIIYKYTRSKRIKYVKESLSKKW